MTMATDEQTPLLADGSGHDYGNGNGSANGSETTTVAKHGRLASWWRSVFHVENRILLAGFLITLSFSYTQVPLLYMFHMMECDIFYDSHPPYLGPGDRCSRKEIAAGTATQFSILGMSTSLCGTVNLFITGWVSKKMGPRFALLMQVFVPAIRVATQIIGVIVGKRDGEIIIQATQLITLLGGPSGYILVVNIIAGHVTEPARRTAVFGKLQGALMLAQGIGYLAGGKIGDAISIRAPFDAAFISFIVAGIYSMFALPYIAPEDASPPSKNSQKGGVWNGLVAPLRILAPQRLRHRNGSISKHYGVALLCCGIFLGVLATGYAPLLIQMYATAAFDFNQANNGWLMSGYALMRGVFLIFMFPPIISAGRRWMTRRRTNSRPASSNGHSQPIPRDPREFDINAGEQADTEPAQLAKANDDKDASKFDLIFLRWSLLVDGLLTTLAAYATEPWHIYLAAYLLPFGSGTAPAAKGVITEMCTDSQRADALNAVTLVENVARLATQGFFGFVFAAFAELDIAYATFFVNAAVAVVGMLVLLFSHFPSDDTELIDDHEDGEEHN